MTLNLMQLKELMAPLTKLCKKEKEIKLPGITVVIKYLNPKEELEVQKLLPDINNDSVTAVEFADIFRRETLCRAIVQVGDVDLRDLDLVETGEKLSDGKSVKVSKEEAVVQIMSVWSRQVIGKLFEQYGVLSEEIEKDLDESLRINVEDKELEKENLQERIEELDRSEKLENLQNDEQEVP